MIFMVIAALPSLKRYLHRQLLMPRQRNPLTFYFTIVPPFRPVLMLFQVVLS